MGTAVGTFDFKIEKSFLQDKRNIDPDEKAKERGNAEQRKDPEPIGIAMYSAMKVPPKNQDSKAIIKEADKIIQIGQLNIRILGYVLDSEKSDEKAKKKKQQK